MNCLLSARNAFLLSLLMAFSLPVAARQKTKEITGLHIQPTNASLIGRGPDQAVASITFSPQSGLPQTITVKLEGSTDIRDIERATLYLSDRADRFDPRSLHTAIAMAKPSGNRLTFSTKFARKTNTHKITLWLCLDIAGTAREGNTVKTSFLSIDAMPVADAPTTEHTIVPMRTLVWMPGDDGSVSYRIPGIVTCADGTLVACADKRKNHSGDLPADIDVLVKRSSDGGKTWSKPITVAKGTPDYGYGDAAMAISGSTITMVMVGGNGLWHSNPRKMQEMFVCRSTDGGKTWTEPRNITAQVYRGKNWPGGFFASGRGLVTSDGTIVFVAAMRTSAEWGGPLENILVYSRDEGKTWLTSDALRNNGDESKVVELADGRLLVSSRNRDANPNPRSYALTADLGKTWTPLARWEDMTGTNCNGAIIRYSAKNSGAESRILLHTLPADKDRVNLTLFVSKDSGKTWPYRKTICKGESAYSSLTILPNGNIGILSEEDDQIAYDIWFTEVSLGWLLSEK